MNRPAVVIVEDNRDIAELEALEISKFAASVEVISQDFERCLHPHVWLGVTCAVLDLMLPHIDGEDICRYLRDNHPNIRRVICTAKPVSQLADVAELADVVLSKPFLMDDLAQAVQ